MQELLLGEQSPSPSLSRSSSVSSVLMVSIFRLSLSSSFPVPFIIIFVIVVLLPRCHHHPRHHLCQLCHPHNLSWTEAPTTPPVKMCSRWKRCCCDWQESYSRWTTLDIWERFLTDFFAKFHLFLSSRWAERKERIQQHRNETRARSLFLWKKTQRERGERGNWRGRTSDWKNRFCHWQRTKFFVGCHTLH